MLTVITDRGAFLVPPCPPWCMLRADHDVADPFSYDVEGLLRHHGREWPLRERYPTVSVELTWTEGIGYRPGHAPAEPPGLHLFADDDGSALTPSSARQLARLLIEAADFYESEVR